MLLILLLSVASIWRKLLKTTHTEERGVHTNSESCNIQLGSKTNLIPNKSFRYHKQQSSIIFRRIRYSWYFIISFYLSWSESYFSKHLFLFRGVFIMKTTFSYFPGMFKNPAPAKYYFWKFEISTVCIIRLQRYKA